MNIRLSLFLLISAVSSTIYTRSFREYCENEQVTAEQMYEELLPSHEKAKDKYEKKEAEAWRLSIRATFFEQLPICMSYKPALSEDKAAEKCFNEVSLAIAVLNQMFVPTDNRDKILYEELQKIQQEIQQQLDLQETK